MSGPKFRIPVFCTAHHVWSFQGGFDRRPNNGNWLVCLQFVRESA